MPKNQKASGVLRVDISLIIPAYNESANLYRCVIESTNALSRITSDYEIIISEDGSTDNTAEIATHLASTFNNVSALHSNMRLGKGMAIKRAATCAKGDIIFFIDSDLSADMSFLPKLISHIKSRRERKAKVEQKEGFDIVIGSRIMSGCDSTRRIRRSVASHAYNLLVRILFNSNIKDHQCGFKAFDRQVFLELSSCTKSPSWFLDTELLIFAQRQNVPIKEVPIKWKESKTSSVPFVLTSFMMLTSLIRLKMRLVSGPYIFKYLHI